MRVITITAIVLIVITMVEVVVVSTIEVVITTIDSCCNRNVICTQSLGKHPISLMLDLDPLIPKFLSYHSTKLYSMTLHSTLS